MRLLLLIVCMLAPGFCPADTIGLDLASVHVPDHGQHDFNPGLYWKSRDGLTLGAYSNSYARLSMYAGLTIEHGPFALTVGVVSGYERHTVDCKRTLAIDRQGFMNVCGESSGSPGYFTALVAPSVRLPEVLGVVPRVTLLPGLHGGSTTFHLSLEREL